MEKHQSYADSFSIFLEHTNEKEVLREEVLQEIKHVHAESVLDIGAGRGELGKAIATEVKDYTAIESNALYVERLKKMNLRVVDGIFPNVDIENNFDFVLASHVISYRSTELQPFFEKAASLIKKEGKFLLVTHRTGEVDDWTKLLALLGESLERDYKNKFQDIVGILEQYGKVNIRMVPTTVETKNIQDMLAALSFVYATGRQELLKNWESALPTIREWIEKNYKTSQGFSFPFRHYFVTLDRA